MKQNETPNPADFMQLGEKAFNKNVHRMYDMRNIQDIKENIYITSDEEIKDVRPHKGKWHLEKGQILNKFPTYLTDLSECKLVIMTTDQDLIKDGVQAIDDEFLEWFVKNPSCEKVEVKPLLSNNGRALFGYKIIIPQEEPKFEDSIENSINLMSIANSMFGKKEESKQETLEEVNDWEEILFDFIDFYPCILPHELFEWLAENYEIPKKK
jgi:hypothetical protein